MIIPCAAAVTALIALGVTRIALISAAALPSDQQAIQPNELYEWVRLQTPKGAEAVFIGGNGFRAIGTIEAPEENLDRPILTANQVAF